MAPTNRRGGPRPNSGRPRNAEPTEVIRLPIDIADAARRAAAARGGSASGIGGFFSGQVRLYSCYCGSCLRLERSL